MKQFMVLVVLIGSFWAGQAWADMDRVSKSEYQATSMVYPHMFTIQ